VAARTAGGTGGDGWRFIKINGVAPTLVNVQKAKYDYFSEATSQCNKVAYTAGGDVKAFCDTLPALLGDPVIIEAINKFEVHSWGNGGELALPTNGFTPPSPPFVASGSGVSYVNTMTKSPTGAANNCQKPVIFGTPTATVN
jgi:hypothetical protein